MNDTGDTDLDLEAALAALKKATEEYEEAARVEREASHAETAAMNRLTDAQRRFDGVVANIRRKAPARSEWARNPRRPRADA